MTSKSNDDPSYRHRQPIENMHGVSSLRRKCSKCNGYKLTLGGINKRGYSRHEPYTFICKDCR